MLCAAADRTGLEPATSGVTSRRSPTELTVLAPCVDPVGVEPTRFCLQSRCSPELSYEPLVIAPTQGFEPRYSA